MIFVHGRITIAINTMLQSTNDYDYVPYSSNISNRIYLLEFFLGGDMKFLFTVLGMNACICKIDKNDRVDMTKDEHFY